MANTFIEMYPIPYRHIMSTTINWVEEQHPQLKEKIVDIQFSPKGLIVMYRK